MIYKTGSGAEASRWGVANTSPSPYPGDVRTSEAAILPYMPYPTNPVTGCPADTHLPILQPRRASQLGALMSDPITGIEVPVLAVTFHPQTREWLTLGGTYCSPLTKTLAPLELGGPMEDPVTGGIVPILGVGLDEHTGLLETINAFHPVAPAWPSCPVSPSLLSSSYSGQAENDTPFSLSTLPLLPTLPSSSKFPSPLPPSLPQYPHGKFTLEVNPRAAPPFFLPLVLLWPCPAFLLPCALHVYTTTGLFPT